MLAPVQDTFAIPLSQNQVAFLCERDWQRLSKHTWSAWWNPSTKSFYAMREDWQPGGKGKGHRIYMHRAILGLDRGDKRQGHHEDHNTLNNRRSNLCVVSHRRNNELRKHHSRYGPGVRKRPSGRFQAEVSVADRIRYIGTFDTAESARQARRDYLQSYGGTG